MARKQKKYHFIYKTTNLLNGKYYYGMHSTNNLDDGYLGSGTYLRRSLNKYGNENHKKEIVEFCETRELLKQRESEIITLNEIAIKKCMNLRIGGSGGFGISECKKGADSTHKLYKDKLSEWGTKGGKTTFKKYGINKNFILKRHDFTGKKHSDKSKKKMSESSKGMGKGDLNSQYNTMWITKNGINKKIKKEELNLYISNNWKKGRKLK